MPSDIKTDETATENVNQTPKEDDSEDECDILEESPCGRWLKRKEEVQQRNVPGIDDAYLAMDTEEGVEVVWNEVTFSERRNFKAKEEKIRHVFNNLIQLEHPNIVKFHKYWIDHKDDRARVIFITEYMSSGSLKQFLKRTKRNVKKIPLHSWKRWCIQILSALSYLHSCTPPIIHGDLTCDTIFIQHNGLVKIGSGICHTIYNSKNNLILAAPDAIHHYVKTCRENMRNMHYIAPEYGTDGVITPAADIYSFGMCALEIAALEIQGNGDSGLQVTPEAISKTIDSLDDHLQQDFIRCCLQKDPHERPTARKLLFHPVCFEISTNKFLEYLPESYDEYLQQHYSYDSVLAELPHIHKESYLYHVRDIPVNEKLEKFVEDVKFGIYPLTAFSKQQPHFFQPVTASPQENAPLKLAENSYEPETRRILNMMCNVKACKMTLLLRLDDRMNRQLSCDVYENDTANILADELVKDGFICHMDQNKVSSLIEDTLRNYLQGLTLKLPATSM